MRGGWTFSTFVTRAAGTLRVECPVGLEKVVLHRAKLEDGVSELEDQRGQVERERNILESVRSTGSGGVGRLGPLPTSA